MSTTMPQPIAAYMQAHDPHNTDAMLEALAPDAVITDDGKTYTTPDTIRAWSDASHAAYQPHYRILEVVQNDDVTRVTAEVSGNFEGSPANLQFDFTLKDDQIATLDIH